MASRDWHESARNSFNQYIPLSHISSHFPPNRHSYRIFFEIGFLQRMTYLSELYLIFWKSDYKHNSRVLQWKNCIEFDKRSKLLLRANFKYRN